MWNPVKTIGTGFEYSVVGSQNSGYRFTVMGRRNPEWFKTLEGVHKRLELAFRIYMQDLSR